MGLRLVRRRPAPLAWAAGAWAVPAGAARPVPTEVGLARTSLSWQHGWERRGVAGAPHLLVAPPARGRRGGFLANRARWPPPSNAAATPAPATGTRRRSLGTRGRQSLPAS